MGILRLRTKKLFSRRWINKRRFGSTAASILDCEAYAGKKSKNHETKKVEYSCPAFNGSWSLQDCSHIVNLDLNVDHYKRSSKPLQRMPPRLRAEYNNVKYKINAIRKDADKVLKFLEQWKRENFKDER